ncbi:MULTISPECIES: hypothetical protein [unclassified Streptomyces]|uniref:hypothetical protein n=1 Tax=unclassified Streptomyces TaxID=2593676 RepID=UPI00381C0103
MTQTTTQSATAVRFSGVVKPYGAVRAVGLAIPGGLRFPVTAFPNWLRSIAEYTPTHRFAGLGRATSQGHAPGAATIALMAAWLLAFGSYAVVSCRRSARTA